MILVINPSEGKAYNLADSSYVTTDYGIIADGARVVFNETDEAQGDKFGNVFVVKILNNYNVSARYQNGDISSIEYEYENYPLGVNLTGSDSSLNYSISFDEKERFIAFDEGVENKD